MTEGTEVAFVLSKFAEYPEPAKVIASAARHGVQLALVAQGDAMVFELADGANFLLMLVAEPYPDAPEAPAHFILSGTGIDAAQMIGLVAAVTENITTVDQH